MILCVCVFIKLHTTAQSGPVILVILCQIAHNNCAVRPCHPINNDSMPLTLALVVPRGIKGSMVLVLYMNRSCLSNTIPSNIQQYTVYSRRYGTCTWPAGLGPRQEKDHVPGTKKDSTIAV